MQTELQFSHEDAAAGSRTQWARPMPRRSDFLDPFISLFERGCARSILYAVPHRYPARCAGPDPRKPPLTST